jgi:hypothetical protein
MRWENRNFRQHEHQSRKRGLLLPGKLKLMVRSGMGLMSIVVVMVIIGMMRVVMRLNLNVSTAAVMSFCEKMNPDVIEVEREDQDRHYASPPPSQREG